MAAIVMEKFPTVTSDVASSNGKQHQFTISLYNLRQHKRELGRMLMCIFMSENAQAISEIWDKNLEELGAMNDASSLKWK